MQITLVLVNPSPAFRHIEERERADLHLLLNCLQFNHFGGSVFRSPTLTMPSLTLRYNGNLLV